MVKLDNELVKSLRAYARQRYHKGYRLKFQVEYDPTLGDRVVFEFYRRTSFVPDELVDVPFEEAA